MRCRTSKSAWLVLVLLPPVLATLVPVGAWASTSRTVSSTGLVASADAAVDRRAAAIVSRMTLPEKVGQLFVVAVNGERSDTSEPTDVAANRAMYGVDNAEQVVDRYHVGGFIYFTRTNNTKNPRQIAALSNGIQRAAMRQRMAIPMLISTDQEQGVVNRIGPPLTQFPGSMALAASRHATADAAEAAFITGRELSAVGVNQDFAPVADVNLNPRNPVIGVRSFGSDPKAVARLTAAQVAAFRRAGVVATAKHFPGHGDTTADSHLQLPVITHTRRQVSAVDLPPFRAAISHGVESIMTAHIAVPALDPSGDPATFSRPIITGMLREQLGFDGVVVADALDMRGARQKYPDARVPVLALNAGVDQLLMPPRFTVAYNAVLAAVRRGELTQARIDASVVRILSLKLRHGLFAQPYVDESKVPGRVGTSQHLGTAQQITSRTVTLVKNDNKLLPLRQGPRRVLVTGNADTITSLARAIAAWGATTTGLATGTHPGPRQISAAAGRARVNDLVVATTVDVGRKGHTQQQALVRTLLGTGKPVVVVAVGTPYDIGWFPDAPTYLATYSHRPIALAALARVLYGDVNPSGQLPVAIPAAGQPATDLYPIDHRLRYRS
jgi:beta-N-acetylhexosaminidase